jgi:spore coat polysaccharide biosynthesis protein SpsF
MKLGVVIMARMGSSRLPGKVLKEVAGRSLLALLVERARRARGVDEVIVATSVEPSDDIIASRAPAMGASVFRGSEEDAFDRLLGAVEAHNLDFVVRVTGDCPLIDPGTIEAVGRMVQTGAYDYVTTDFVPQYPNGMGCEGYLRATIEKMHKASRRMDSDLTWLLARDPNMNFRIGQIEGSRWGDISRYRLTVDTPEDLDLVTRIITALAPTKRDFTLDDIVDLLHQHPDWATINAHVPQKSGPHRRTA